MRLLLRSAGILIIGLVIATLTSGCQTTPSDNDSYDGSKPKESRPERNRAPKSGAPREKQPEPGAQRPAAPPTLADVAGYKDWLKFNRQPIEGRTHGQSNIYVNQERAAIAPDGELKFPFPDGTIIVKEIVDSGWVAIMKKQKGADSAHGDWQWIEYKQDGSVAGADSSCWGCHGEAKSTDYVFTKLED